MTPALTAYLSKHTGWKDTAKETPVESPLQFLLAHAAEQQKIAKRGNHDQVQEAAAE